MACYGCGSAEGNDARLCPACNQKKFDEQNELVTQLSAKSEDFPIPPLTKEQKILLSVGSFLLLVGLWWILAPSNTTVRTDLPAAIPTASPLESAFSGCLRKFLGPNDAGHDEEAVNHATKTCNVFKASCVVSPEGAECQTFIKEYSTTSEVITGAVSAAR
jgi:hypothetical protein